MEDRRSEIAIAAMAVLEAAPKLKVATAHKIAESVVHALFGSDDIRRSPIDVAYQIVGALGHYTDTFEHPDVQRALNYLSGEDVPDILPWPREAIIPGEKPKPDLEQLREALESPTLGDDIRALATELANKQSPLGAEFTRAWDENVDKLYED